MSRYYSVPFTAVAVAAEQDVFEITVGTSKAVRLHEIVIGQYSDAGDSAAELLGVSIKRGVTNTAGSGGSSATPVSHVSDDAAAGFTAKINNTTQATATGGTLTVLRSEAFNVQGGYQYLPLPSQKPVFLPNQTCIVSITAPADSLTMSGTIVLEEGDVGV